MKLKKFPKATVLIINYNNSNYIKRCIKSVLNQTYQNIEIIFVDDLSTDDSIKKVKKFKSVKVFKTKTKTRFGSLNQLNACKVGFSKSKGELIFFLDSDDFFLKNKVRTTIEYYRKYNFNVCFDKPYLYFNKKNKKELKIKKRSKILIPWPQFGPQSCIAIKKQYLKKIWKKISSQNFKNIWLDFRIINQATIEYDKVFSIPNYLTMYQQKSNSASSHFKKFSKNWWLRRWEAHQFLKHLYKMNNRNLPLSLDGIITYFVNKII